MLLHVGADAEGATLAGEDHGTDIDIGGDDGEDIEQLGIQRLDHGIEAMGPVEANLHHLAVALGDQGLVGGMLGGVAHVGFGRSWSG